MKTGIQLIEAERERQELGEGWTAEHDDQHTEGELARAGAVYALPPKTRDQIVLKNDEFVSVRLWPFKEEWYKPTPEDRIRELEKAGALIAAEIDRLQRLKSDN